MLVIEEQS